MRESPNFIRELVLLPGPQYSHVPRRGTKALLFESGHVVSAVEFLVCWDEAEVLAKIGEVFHSALNGAT